MTDTEVADLTASQLVAAHEAGLVTDEQYYNRASELKWQDDCQQAWSDEA